LKHAITFFDIVFKASGVIIQRTDDRERKTCRNLQA